MPWNMRMGGHQSFFFRLDFDSVCIAGSRVFMLSLFMFAYQHLPLATLGSTDALKLTFALQRLDIFLDGAGRNAKLDGQLGNGHVRIVAQELQNFPRTFFTTYSLCLPGIAELHTDKQNHHRSGLFQFVAMYTWL